VTPVEVEGPGHFIGADRCRFVRHHHIGRYCVSTVGNYRPSHSPDAPAEVGHGRTHETYVFDLERPDDAGRWTEARAFVANSDAEAEEAHRQGLAWAAESL
jgi:hypothetical protein